jgi:PAS domain S-box-containing protein
MIGTHSDITERKKAEQNFRESEERYKAIFKDSKSVMLIIDPENGNINDANQAAADFYGYSVKELTSMNIKSINILSEKEIKEEMKNANDNSKNKFNFKHKLSNGETRDVEVYSGKLLFGEKEYLHSIIHDITEQKKAEKEILKKEKELLKLNSEKDKFFSIIAHDLKSPFNSILGFANLLHENFEDYDTKKQKEFINIIKESAYNTYKLVDNLLIWSHLQLGKTTFNPTKENLHLSIKENFTLFKQSANNKSIKLMNKVSENIFLNSDKNMLLTILRNLISNSLKFTEKGGEISIDAYQAANNNMIEIIVEDSGIGIHKEIKKNLFKISENVSTLGTENEKGTGLGLILTKDFVNKHGGTIRVESKPGKGSKFIFTMPSFN